MSSIAGNRLFLFRSRDQSPALLSARKENWIAAIGAGIGTGIEYYDFQLFGILSIFLGPAFFSSQHKDSGLLAALAVFGGAFLARPLGGYIFGLIGDTISRRRALLITVIGMGAASTITGLLPSAHAIGHAAPVLLVLLRLLQGFFAGGEVTGAATYIAECAPRGERGFFGALNPAFAVFGLTLATGSTALIETSISPAEMQDWGWRIPFILSVPLIVICLVARTKLRDPPGFTHDKVHITSQKQPIIAVFRSYKKPLAILVVLAFAQNVSSYMGLIYLGIQLTHSMGYDTVSVSWLVAITSFLAGVAMPFAGHLSDRLGRKPVIGAGFLGYVFLAPISLYIAGFDHFGWTAAAILMAAIPLVLVQATGYPLYAELFPTHVRYTGMSLGFNVAAILGGGTAPYLGVWLSDVTGSNLAPALYVSATCLTAFFVSRLLRETSDDDIEITALGT